ncbi:MAG TPA: beta-galactosidase [Vicinamibacterales bacterium]|jgi:beta-galactosidase|nr:beta-galactosidase [Vicinamibacterales bacterium]
MTICKRLTAAPSAAVVGLALALCWPRTPVRAQVTPRQGHTFALAEDAFLLDGQPFQIVSGEMHPARIPVEYWRHRIQMAKAMGVNTIAIYVFWNYHEQTEGAFDFTTGNRDIARFIRLAQEEGLWVLLRPGPYVCAEWDFGGIPPYLLADPELKIRSTNPHYMKAVDRYIGALAPLVKPLLVANGGPILMVQIENEYGSYGNDRAYLEQLRDIWTKNGVRGPFYTADGPTPYMLEAGRVEGAAIGLDSGTEEKDWDLAKSIAPRVPVFSSETYPGWLTHWGEPWARPAVDDLLKEMRFLMEGRKSFNLYVVHGGTNFGFTAGANSGGKGYEPDVTSYDYDAPIDEQGRATSKYSALRALIASYLPRGAALPTPPAPIPSSSVPSFELRPYASIWDQLPAPVAAVQPGPFERYGQNQGLMLYRTTLVGRKSGRLTITELHDYALVFVDGRYIGALDRRLGENSIELPAATGASPVLDILVEGMGHINFGPQMIDRKGITDRVTLGSMTLMNWQVYPLPVSDPPTPAGASERAPNRPGVFFRGTFTMARPADTFLDMTNFRKGVVWVNGHNLGRYWDVGPQTHLYCPAPWIRAGENEVIAFDLSRMDSATIRGTATPER